MVKEIEYDKDLAKIVSFLTFDGHLAEDLKGFYFSSKKKYVLKQYACIVLKKFDIKGRYETGTGYGTSFKYRCFSRIICRFLSDIGVPKGNKVKKQFQIPEWIARDKKYSREYLRTAFDCEGSIWFEKQPKIRFGMCKIEELLENGIEFLEQMKSMLEEFDINSTKTWLIKGNNRKDGKITKGLYFKLKQTSLKQFAKEIGFSDRFKKQKLSTI